MPYARVLTVWFIIIIAEAVHGVARQKFLVPVVGDMRSRQIGVFIGSAIIFAITAIAIRWMRVTSSRRLLAVGVLWAVLTVAFEVGFGIIIGASTDRLIEDYDLSRGGLMLFGIAAMILAPYLAFHVRKTFSTAGRS